MGDFHGGSQFFFADDMGDCPVDALLNHAPKILDSRLGWILFDGRRGHMVPDFIGERYSLVFFTISQYSQVPLNQRWALPFYPDQDSIQWWTSRLAPPKGYSPCGKTQIGIRAAFGLPDKHHSLRWVLPTLGGIPHEIAAIIAGFYPLAARLSRRFLQK